MGVQWPPRTLLHGPSGSGKTQLLRWLADRVAPYAEVTWLRPAEVFSRYLGESEERLRNAFAAVQNLGRPIGADLKDEQVWEAVLRALAPLERLSAVTSSVEFWAAGRCSNAAQRALRGWREAARRRASARQGAQRMLQRRRCAFLASWRLLMLRKITAMGLQEAVLLSRALRWLRAWSGWAFAHARQRQSDEVKWAIVRQSRQRWVLERWCSAGRFQRLVLVAEKWDGQVLCRQLVLRAFTGWSAMMGLYACGEKVAAAVGARRASRLLRHWSFLLLVGEKRPHHLMRQMLARWRLFKHRSGEVQRGLERLGRWTLAPTFRRWATYLRDRKTRQQMASTHGDRMQALELGARGRLELWGP
eukprot:g19551.t1